MSVYDFNFFCDFETDECNLQNRQPGDPDFWGIDQFNWEPRNRGSTPSEGTGPDVDHTRLTAQGYYLFIEGSDPRQQSDNAILVSPNFNSGGNLCLRFWYYLYGDHIGELNVYLLFGGTRALLANGRLTKREPEQRWYEYAGTINLPQVNNNFRFAIEAVRGSAYQSDIAIDDISLVSGACGSSAQPLVANNAVAPVNSAVANTVYTESTLVLAVVLSAVLTVLVTIGIALGVRHYRRSTQRSKAKQKRTHMFASMRDTRPGAGSHFGSVRSMYSLSASAADTSSVADDELPKDIDTVSSSVNQ